MTTATLTKVGSSTAAFIPSKLREQAGIVVGDACSIESPHAGVVVHHFHTHSGNDRLVRFERPQSAIQAMGHTLPAWDDGLTADDLLRSGKATRANGIARLRAPPRLSVQRRGQLLSQGGVHAGADAACAPPHRSTRPTARSASTARTSALREPQSALPPRRSGE